MQRQKLSIGFAVLFVIFALTILMTATNATAQAHSLSIINADFSAVPIVCALDYAYQATGGGDCSGPIDPQQDFNSAPGFGWTIVPVSPPVGGGTGAGLTDPNSNFFPPSFAGLPFTQAAFLQNNSAALWQTIGGFSAGGAYTLSFYLGSRYYNGGFDGNQTIQALIGDKVIGTWTLTSFTPFTVQRASFTVSTGGDQTLKFVGLAPGDHTAFISGVAITSFTPLVSFDGTNGSNPQWGALVQGIDGDLYGTTTGGGANSVGCSGSPGCGTVFNITPGGRLTTLHNFNDDAGGWGPMPGLVLATNGDLYGVNSNGGNFGVCFGLGCGVAFKVIPGGTLTTLLEFNLVGAEGGNPNSVLVQATNGNFYGTTINGGTDDDGVIFEMTLAGALTTLHDFDFTDGWGPQNALMVEATDGYFYGETAGGGKSSSCTNNCGTVFKINPGGGFTSLHSFKGTDGGAPSGGLVQASDGNFYGTTKVGGTSGDGTVFKMTPAGTLTTLHSFDGTDGSGPDGGLVQANDGNFYGTTFAGGANGDGTIFEITTGGALTTLHDFSGADGANPNAALLQATDGTFYGTTYAGGTSGDGTVFSLSTGLSPFVTFLPAALPVGNVVGILGQGFKGATGVSVNGTSATFTVHSDTYLTATIPAGATTGNITVTEPSSTLTSNKAFRVTPHILSLSPASGPVGTSVVITGTSFTGATEVTFDCEKNTTFTVDSDTQITATVPAGAISGPIVVMTAGGRGGFISNFTVTP
jgi:uncharacterized repeat protein (TIGR03803 family)